MPIIKRVDVNFYEVESTPEELKTKELEQDNAQHWYDNMMKDSKIESNEAEIAQLWYELMMSGGM